MKLAEENPNLFDVVVLRPGGIVADDGLVAKASETGAVRVSELALALVNVCLNPPAKKILENADAIANAKENSQH